MDWQRVPQAWSGSHKTPVAETVIQMSNIIAHRPAPNCTAEWQRNTCHYMKVGWPGIRPKPVDRLNYYITLHTYYYFRLKQEISAVYFYVKVPCPACSLLSLVNFQWSVTSHFCSVNLWTKLRDILVGWISSIVLLRDSELCSSIGNSLTPFVQLITAMCLDAVIVLLWRTRILAIAFFIAKMQTNTRIISVFLISIPTGVGEARSPQIKMRDSCSKQTCKQ